jgi:hypothetical protein
MLGYTVVDRLTGFRGVVSGYVTYISGCNQCLVVPRAKENSELVTPEWFDEQRLQIDSACPRIVLDNAVAPGFDLAPPKR